MSKIEAHNKKKEFIQLYGRKDINTGCLCNLTDGGDGIWNCKRSAETRQKLSDQKCGSKNHQYGKKQSLSEACRAVNLDCRKYSGKASLVARGLRNHCKGYIFKYLN